MGRVCDAFSQPPGSNHSRCSENAGEIIDGAIDQGNGGQFEIATRYTCVITTLMVIGPTGVGKSRVRWMLLRRVLD
jgi:hypothetical protein